MTPVNIKNKVTFNLTDFQDRSTAVKIGNLIIVTFQSIVTASSPAALFTVSEDLKPKTWVFGSAIVQSYGNGQPIGYASIYSNNSQTFEIYPTASTYTYAAAIGQIMWTI